MLEISSLRVAYDRVEVLHDVSLTVETGTLVSIVGANCAGKSTLINTISCIRRPRAGTILLEGADVSSVPSHELVRRGVVQVPEGRKLFPKMTVEENLFLGATVPDARARRAETLNEVMEIFPRLRERRRQIASTLSGGEQQMVAIARALMARPRLLMLDEPSLGLAPVLVQEMFRIIADLHRRGLTILLVEQNVEDSLATCDYGYVLETGRIVLEGPRKALLENEYLKQAYLGLDAN